MRIYSGPLARPTETCPDNLIILGTVSEGRTFSIYKAQLNTKLVILKTANSNDAMSIGMLRREYELSNSLSHPCIVSTIEFKENTPIGAAIVMEYIEGMSLDEFIAHGASFEQRKSVWNDILSAVSYLHHRGILHNDLKPDNIIINSNGAARIIDFGLSYSDDSAYKGVWGGSNGYSAPEIIDGRGPAGASSDIYSIGLLARLLFGSHRYATVVRKCCQSDPQKRFQSIDSLQRAISGRRRIPLFIFAATIAAVVISIAIYPAISKRCNENKVLSLEEKYEAQMSGYYNDALNKLKVQKYQEFSFLVVEEYMQHYADLSDSLNRAFPMTDAGEISLEIFAFCTVGKRQKAVLDSICLTLPSFTTLPDEEQSELITLFNQGVIPE